MAERNRIMNADPAHKAKVRDALKKARELNPDKFKRTGIPNGMRRYDADEAWFQAKAQARHFIRMLENNGDVRIDRVIVPDSDEAMAKAALKATAEIALGPTPTREKLTALSTLLAYTKQKPVTKIDTNLSANDWLKEAVAHNKASNARDDI